MDRIELDRINARMRELRAAILTARDLAAVREEMDWLENRMRELVQGMMR